MTFDQWFRQIVWLAEEQGAPNMLREQEDYRRGYNDGLTPKQEADAVIRGTHYAGR